VFFCFEADTGVGPSAILLLGSTSNNIQTGDSHCKEQIPVLKTQTSLGDSPGSSNYLPWMTDSYIVASS